MKSLSDLIPLVRTYAPSVPVPVAEQALRLSANQWCRETRCWRKTVSVTLVAAGSFTLAPAYSVVAAVEKMTHDDVSLSPVAFSDLAIADLSATGSPEQFCEAEEKNGFYVIPWAAGTVAAVIYLAPEAVPRFGAAVSGTHQANQLQVPDALVDDDAEALAHGALARLLAHPNQPYSDASAAAYYKGMFGAAVAAKKSETVRGKQRAPMRVKAQWM